MAAALFHGLRCASPAVMHDVVPAGLASETVIFCLFDFIDLKIHITY
jgi:hypothetical protein